MPGELSASFRNAIFYFAPGSARGQGAGPTGGEGRHTPTGTDPCPTMMRSGPSSLEEKPYGTLPGTLREVPCICIATLTFYKPHLPTLLCHWYIHAAWVETEARLLETLGLDITQLVR